MLMQTREFQAHQMSPNHDTKGLVLIIFLGAIGLAALLIPLLPYDPNAINSALIGSPQPPSFSHLFGTDDLGRDILLRCIYGARISLMVGFVAVSISIFIGIIVGLVSGFIGGKVDMMIMRSIDVLMALPTLLILMVQVSLEPSIFNVMVVIGITSWMGMARIVRAEVLSYKERTFVTACKARGLSTKRILFKHILPHTHLIPLLLGPCLVWAVQYWLNLS